MFGFLRNSYNEAMFSTKLLNATQAPLDANVALLIADAHRFFLKVIESGADTVVWKDHDCMRYIEWLTKASLRLGFMDIEAIMLAGKMSGYFAARLGIPPPDLPC